jgi:hypothetical protein
MPLLHTFIGKTAWISMNGDSVPDVQQHHYETARAYKLTRQILPLRCLALKVSL